MEATESIFRNIVEASPYPIYVCTGKEMVVSVANEATLKAWGKDASVIGKRFLEALPEIQGQPFVKLLETVYCTGETYYAKNDRADLVVDGKKQTYYFNFTYQAIRDAQSNITGVLCYATDVTELERARQEVEESQQILYNIVKQAPVGICIIKGNPFYVQVINDNFLKVVGRKRHEFEHLPYWEVIPEAAAMYEPITKNVVDTGKAYIAKEHELMLLRNGVEETVFVDFVYEPITDFDGLTDTILIVAMEVTSQVESKRELQRLNENLATINEEHAAANEELIDVNNELQQTQSNLLEMNKQLGKSEEKLLLAIDSAEMGTWSVELLGNLLTLSERSKVIHGIPTEKDLTLKQFLEVIHPEYLNSVRSAFESAIHNNTPFTVEYVVKPMNGGQTKWLRSTGIIVYGNKGLAEAISGTLLDITQQKQDEQRKNDFIGIVSHELKTPLTTLKANVQMLHHKAVKSGDTFTAGALDMANKQVKKMTTMINGFLNVSRLEAGKIHIDKQYFNMANLIKETEAETALMISSHQIIFAPVETTYVYADRDKIGQVINNLISNAVKYSAVGSTIQVACITVNGQNLVSVQDKGMGISSQDIHQLFDRYYRVEGKHMRTISGFGIGLYLCAEIIQRHDGKIWVESELGKGSIFYFSIPLA